MIRLLLLLLLLSCRQKENNTGSIERFNLALDTIVDYAARVEVLAEGFDWSEGPLWIEKEGMLLFSDVPQNTVYKWKAAKGKEIYLAPSGYTGSANRGGELGSNGLALNKKGQLVLCQHGDRQVGFMQAPLSSPKPEFVALAKAYNGKKFNSPNDLVFDSIRTGKKYGRHQQRAPVPGCLPYAGIRCRFAAHRFPHTAQRHCPDTG
jgi:gluconolactonase